MWPPPPASGDHRVIGARVRLDHPARHKAIGGQGAENCHQWHVEDNDAVHHRRYIGALAVCPEDGAEWRLPETGNSTLLKGVHEPLDSSTASLWSLRVGKTETSMMVPSGETLPWWQSAGAKFSVFKSGRESASTIDNAPFPIPLTYAYFPL